MHKSLNTSIQSFNNTKATIVGSNLGKALGMSTSTKWATVVDKLNGVSNRGNWNGSITTSGGSVTIPAGYHAGSGKVTGPTLGNLIGSSATATSNDHILSGYTAYGENGVKYTGSNKGYAAGRASVSVIKVNQSYYTDPGSWNLTGNAWGSGTAERLMSKSYSYPAGFTSYEAVITVSTNSGYPRVRYITMTGSTSTTMLSSKAVQTDARGGYVGQAGAIISGTLSPNGGSLTLNASISRYGTDDLVIGTIVLK